jgi:hypothetical protein
MKKIGVLFLTLLLMVSCNKETSKQYVSIAGKIENNTDSIISIYEKKILLKPYI